MNLVDMINDALCINVSVFHDDRINHVVSNYHCDLQNPEANITVDEEDEHVLVIPISRLEGDCEENGHPLAMSPEGGGGGEQTLKLKVIDGTLCYNLSVWENPDDFYELTIDQYNDIVHIYEDSACDEDETVEVSVTFVLKN